MKGERPGDAAKAYLCRFYEILDELIEGMTQTAPTDSLPRNYILQTIPHCRAAIDMAENFLNGSDRPNNPNCPDCLAVRQFAVRVCTVQARHLEAMRRALEACPPTPAPRGELCLYRSAFRRIAEQMFDAMQSAPATSDIAADFLRELIPHRKGAIRLAENAERFGLCPALKSCVDKLTADAQTDIADAEALLSRLEA